MDIKSIKLLGFGTLLLILFTYACTPRCDHIYVFDQYMNIYPAQDTFMVGDTFYMEMDMNTYMYNKYQNNYVELGEHGLTDIVYIYQLSSSDSNGKIDDFFPGSSGSLTPIRTANDKFNFECSIGEWSEISYGASIKPEVIGDKFLIKTKVSLLDTGLFLFSFLDIYSSLSVSDYRPNLITQDDCFESWYGSWFTVNDGECNHYLLENMNISNKNSSGALEEPTNHSFVKGNWPFVVVPKK